jgi:serine/threonine-protein kinase
VVADTYYVRELLRSGGMGDVYEVEHIRLGRAFAAKFLNRERLSDPACVERFEGEALALARVRSAYVVSIVDRGHDFDQVPFLIMERLIGADLRTLLKHEAPLSVPRACKLVLDAAAGLSAIHGVGLVHGDIKPSNLFVSRDDFDVERCQVLDLGLWRTLDGAPTVGTSGAGTVRYMAPEQLTGRGSVDQRTDIYALGAVLYECLCGYPPHRDECVERTMYSIIHACPRPFDDLAVAVPKQLEQVVLRALSPAADARFESAAEFIAALAPFARRAQSPAVATRADADESTRDVANQLLPRAGKTRGAGVALAAVVSLCVAGALMGAAWSRGESAGPGPASLPQLARRASRAVPIESSPARPSASNSPAVDAHAGPAKAEPVIRSEMTRGRWQHSQAAAKSRTGRTPLLGDFDRESPYDEPAP